MDAEYYGHPLNRDPNSGLSRVMPIKLWQALSAFGFYNLTLLRSATKRVRQVELIEFKANLVYLKSSRIARVRQLETSQK